MELIMPEKFPDILPPKGEGRVDSKHRVALLTEPEIGALNFLKNMDKAMGYKSGFSPMMQNLASQDTQPLDFVEYRGERIPSLNDFGSGAGKNEGAGEQEVRQQTQSGSDYGGQNDWAARERRRKAEKAAAEKAWQDKLKKDREEAAKIKEINNYVDEQIRLQNARREERRRQLGQTGDYPELDDEGNIIRPERDPGYRPPEYGEPGYEEPSRYPEETTTPPPDDDGGLENTYDVKPQFQAWDGSMHWSQEGADAENQLLLDEGYASKKSELEGYGGEATEGVYGQIESDFETFLEDTLTSQRESAYNQALAGLYDDQQLSGVWDQDAYDTALSGLDEAVLTETGELEDYGASLKSDAEGAYDTWMASQLEGLGDLQSGATDASGYQALQDWSWEDLDLSDFTSDQDYQDFDFLTEFKKLTPEGETIAAEAEGEIEGAEGGVDAAPASRTTTRKKKKFTPVTSSASLTGSGSSSNIS